MKRISLKTQLTIIFGALMLFFSAILLIFLLYAGGSAIRSDIQQRMIRIVERDIDEAEYQQGVFTPESDFVYYSDSVHVVLCSKDGTILGGTLPENFTPPETFADGEMRTYDSDEQYYIYDTLISYKKYEYSIDAFTGEILSYGADEAFSAPPAFDGNMSAWAPGAITAQQAYEISLANERIASEDALLMQITYGDSTGSSVYSIEFYSEISNYEDVWVRGIAKSHDGEALTLFFLCILIMPLLISVVCILAYLLTKRALQPLDKVIETANHYSDGENLSERTALQHGTKELLQLSDAFDSMAERLQHSFAMEKRFTSDVSHELRTPVTIITAECSYALGESVSDEERKESLQVIQRQSNRMKTMITRLLEFTRMEQGTAVMNKETADLSELTNAVCEDMQSFGAEKNIRFETNIQQNICMEMDVALITQLLTNLLSNAIRYGKENTRVQISLQQDDEHIRLQVADEGIGIRKEDLDGIWKRFYRAESSVGDGMGLGLPLVKSIAALHGATVRVESEYGKGSTFFVIFSKK